MPLTIRWPALAVAAAALTCFGGQALAQGSGLGLSRTAELQQLSVCPAQPTVGVFGGAVGGLLVTALVQQAPGIAVVERQRLSAITAEQCLGPSVDPATASPNGQLQFAMYLAEVQADLAASPLPVSIRMIRVDSGAAIFERSTTLAPGAVGALEQFVREAVPGMVSAIAANAYACTNQFRAVITEDVTLACQGAVPQTGTTYQVDGAFSLEFTLQNFDYAARGAAQQLSGSARLLPATVRTTLRDSISRDGPRCAFTMNTERAIAINLAPASVPAGFALTIPPDTGAPWTFAPAIAASAPLLFRGPATLTATMTTVAGSNCQTPGGTVARETKYQHLSPNDFAFGSHEIRPVCGPGHPVPVALATVPKLGTPNAVDVTSGCSVRSARARFSFQRRLDPTP